MEVGAAVLFGLALLLGAGMVNLKVRGRKFPPIGFVVPHAVFALGGFVLYLLAVLGAEDPAQLAVIALALFGLVILGGILLFLLNLKGRAAPLLVMVGHGGTAAVAYVLLLIALLTAGAGGVG